MEGACGRGPSVFKQEREKVSILEQIHTFRTFVPLSNSLINGALVTCKKWRLSDTAVIFSLPQSINVQELSFIRKSTRWFLEALTLGPGED
jgi:hypothetical protein